MFGEKKKDELSVEDWVDQINDGLKYRQVYGSEKQWAEIEAIYQNGHESQINAGPNLLFSTGDALISELTVNDPYLTLKARKPEFINGSKLLETVDNTLISDMEMPFYVSRSVLSAYLWGVGIVKVGFDSEYGFDPTHDAGGKKQPLGLTLTQHDPKTANLIEYLDSVSPGSPWINSVLPHDIVVPWGVIDFESAPWVAHRVVRHIDAVKADAKYENKKDLKATMSMEDFVKSYQTTIKPYRLGSDQVRRNLNDSNAEFCELWEIHEKRTGKIFVIATGHDKFIRNEINLLQIRGLPFIGYSFTPRARTFWTTSDALYIKRIQAEISDITVQQTKLRRLMNLKFLYDEDMIDESELVKAMSHDAGVGVKIKNKGKPIDEAIKFLTAPPNYELNNQAQQVRQNLKETIGFNSNTFGEYQSGRKTASEVNAVQAGAGQRMSRRTGILRSVYEKTFKKINPMLQKFWTQPKIMQIVGPNGLPIWMQFTGQHLGGEYDYSCGFSDNTVETKDSRRQMAIQMFASLSQSPLVNPVALAQYLANQFNDVDFSGIFQPGVLLGVPSANQQAQQIAIQQQGSSGPQQAGLVASAGGGNMGQNGGQQTGAGISPRSSRGGGPQG